MNPPAAQVGYDDCLRASLPLPRPERSAQSDRRGTRWRSQTALLRRCPMDGLSENGMSLKNGNWNDEILVISWAKNGRSLWIGWPGSNSENASNMPLGRNSSCETEVRWYMLTMEFSQIHWQPYKWWCRNLIAPIFINLKNYLVAKIIMLIFFSLCARAPILIHTSHVHQGS